MVLKLMDLNHHYLHNVKTGYEIKVKITSGTQSQLPRIIGTNANFNWFAGFRYTGALYMNLLYYTPTAVTGGSSPIGKDLVYHFDTSDDINHVYAKVSGNLVIDTYPTRNTTTTTIGNLCLIGGFSSAMNACSVRIYYTKIWDGEKLVMNLIPVRQGTDAFLYDTINKEIYRNWGSNPVLYGADV